MSQPSPDPWSAFGHLVAGVGIYGFLGWWADRWLGTSFLVVLGILTGAALGTYLSFVRFLARAEPPDAATGPEQDTD